MKDQQKQALKSFTGIIKPYKLFVTLSSEQDHVKIKVQDMNTLESYSIVIDMDYIAKEKDFINIFEEPLEILDYFVHHYQEVLFQKGIIKFEFSFGNLKKRVKAIAIKLNKEELNPVQFAQIKIERMKETLAQRQQKIAFLQKQLEKSQFQNRQLTKNFQYLQLKYKEIMQQLQELSINNEVLKNEYLNQYRKKNKDFRGMKQQLRGALMTWTKIAEIQPGQDELNIIAQVVSLQPVGNKRCRVVFGDQTGIVKSFLFNNPLLKVGNTIALIQAEANVNREHIELQLMERGSIEQGKRGIKQVNLANDISEKEWIQQV